MRRCSGALGPRTNLHRRVPHKRVLLRAANRCTWNGWKQLSYFCRDCLEEKEIYILLMYALLCPVGDAPCCPVGGALSPHWQRPVTNYHQARPIRNMSPHRRVPHKRVPHKRACHGRGPHGRVPHGRLPQGRIPQGRIPQGRTPHRRVLYGRVYSISLTLQTVVRWSICRDLSCKIRLFALRDKRSLLCGW